MQEILQVLDHGQVQLLECYGGDQAVIRAARQCYCSESTGPEADCRLIHKLLRSKPQHGTPFEFAVLLYHLKLPLFVRDQIVRYRTACCAVKSLRYCTLEELEVYRPFDNPINSRGASLYERSVQDSFESYQLLLSEGWKPEQARMVLPSATYTEMLWQVNCRNLMNYLSQRLDKHAQPEHQEYAKAIEKLWAEAMPITAEAWKELH